MAACGSAVAVAAEGGFAEQCLLIKRSSAASATATADAEGTGFGAVSEGSPSRARRQQTDRAEEAGLRFLRAPPDPRLYYESSCPVREGHTLR